MLIYWLGAFGVYWCSPAAVLWWAYGFSHLVSGGIHSQDRAISLVAQMGLIVTVLAGLVWFFQAHKLQTPEHLWRRGWIVLVQTILIHLTYAAIVIGRRQMWDPSQGINDDAMFLPIVGFVNGRFFSEFKFLSFIVVVVPIMGLISAILFSLGSYLSFKNKVAQ